MRPHDERTVDYEAYGDWRHSSLEKAWEAFSDSNIAGKDVLDFGSGDGQLSLFLAKEKHPRRIVGVDIEAPSIERAKASLAETQIAEGIDVEFVLGSTDQLPLPDESFDTLIAIDCLEHVMTPIPILRDWYRVLRPGGRCLIEWFPFENPWGPHMDTIVPIPWAHVIFGERAMFQTAAMVYDLPEYVPRHWDLDEDGNKLPNKWRTWSSFEEQAFINKLSLSSFRKMAHDVGFQIARCDLHGFGGSKLRKTVGHMLMKTPLVGKYFLSYVNVELVRP